MLKRVLISLIAAAVFGILSYLLLNSIYLPLAIALVSFLAFFFLVVPAFFEWRKKGAKFVEGYRFVNAFIVSYAVSNSAAGAYSAAASSLGEEGKEAAEVLASRDIQERIDGLESYFDAPYYRMFLSLFKLQVDQGGSFIEKAMPLLEEMNQAYDDYNQKEKEKGKQIGQWVSLWLMSALIVIFVRFSLNNNFASVSSSLPYTAVAVAYFMLAIAGFILFARRISERPLFERKLPCEK